MSASRRMRLHLRRRARARRMAVVLGGTLAAMLAGFSGATDRCTVKFPKQPALTVPEGDTPDVFNVEWTTASAGGIGAYTDKGANQGWDGMQQCDWEFTWYPRKSDPYDSGTDGGYFSYAVAVVRRTAGTDLDETPPDPDTALNWVCASGPASGFTTTTTDQEAEAHEEEAIEDNVTVRTRLADQADYVHDDNSFPLHLLRPTNGSQGSVTDYAVRGLRCQEPDTAGGTTRFAVSALDTDAMDQIYDVYVVGLVAPRGGRQFEHEETRGQMWAWHTPFDKASRVRTIRFGAPSVPEDLRVSGALDSGVVDSAGGVTLQWSPPTRALPTLTGYRYRYRQRDEAVWGEWSATVRTEATINGLDVGVTYVFEVQAVNAVGAGVGGRTVATLAERVLLDDLQASLASRPRTVELTWDLFGDAGVPLLRFEYRYERLAEGETCATHMFGTDGWRSTRNVLGAVVDGLALGQTYRFQARGVNALGAGDPVSACLDVGTVPQAPTVDVEFSAGGFDLIWRAPPDGGFAVSQYEYLVVKRADFDEEFPDFGDDPDARPTDEDPRWQIACGAPIDSCAFRVSAAGDLAPETEYVVLFRGVNAIGGGVLTVVFLTTRPDQADAPESLAARPLDGAIELVWETVEDDGGVEVWLYRFRENVTGDEANWSPWFSAGSELRVVVHGLSNAVEYEFEVRGVGAAGYGRTASTSGTPAAPVAQRGIVRDFAASEVACSGASCDVTLTWSAPAGDAPTRYEFSEGGGAWEAVLATTRSRTIRALDAGTTYSFYVRAVTAAGGTGPAASVTVSPGEAPGAPRPDDALPNLAGDGEVTLHWLPPLVTSGPILRYEYRYRAQFMGASWSDWLNAGLARTVPIENLTNDVGYDLEVRAVNAVGEGPAWRSSARPVAGVVAGVPGNLAVQVGDAFVSLTWPAARDSNGGPAAGYVCQYRPEGGVTPLDCVTGGDELATCLAPTILDTAVRVTGLTNGIPYRFEVRSCTAAPPATGQPPDTSDPARAEATPTAVVSAPGSPQELVAQAADGAVTLRWDVAPTGDGASVTHYELRWRRVGEEFGEWTDACRYAAGDPMRSRCKAVLEWTVDSLVNGTRFHFELRARKGEIAGPAVSVWAIPAGVPHAPLDIGYTVGAGELSVTWHPPPDGGAEVDRYEYRMRSAGGEFGNWSPVADRLVEQGDRFTILLTGLRDDVEYRVEVRAVNAVGPGPAAAVVSVPGASAQSALSAQPGDGEVELRWRATSESDIVRYELRCTPGAADCEDWADVQDLIRRDGRELSVRVTGLVNGTEYTFEVRSVDDGLAGTIDVVRAVPSAVPGPPGLTVRAGDGDVELAWRAPDQDGGSPVVRYEYRWKVSGGEFGAWQGAPTGRAVTVGGLVNGEEHVFAVRAVNAAGTGRAATAATTPAGAPSAPRGLTAERGDGAVTLRWSPPDLDGGLAVRGYEYRHRLADAGFAAWTALGVVGETTVSGLTNGVAYVFEVRAANAVSTGAAATLTAAPGAVPGAPQRLETEVGDGQVALRWDEPTEDGGLEILRYEVRSSAPDQAPGAWTEVALERSTTVEGLTNGVAYVFEVRAVNAEGGGTVASAVATPWVATVPEAPVMTARADSRAVTLAWTVPDNGGDAITRYQYRWRVDGEAFGDWLDAALGTSATVEELVNGVAYEFEVRAVNGIGAGGVASATATPAGLPGVPVLEARAGAEEVVLTWRPPDDDGGLAILRYEYRWRGEEGTFVDWRDAGLDSGATARGLRNGTTYLFEVRAVNRKGAGEAATASATPAAGVADTTLAGAWMARFGRVSASHVTDALEARFAGRIASGVPPRRESRPRSPTRRSETAPTGRVPESERVRHRGGTGGRTPGASRWTSTDLGHHTADAGPHVWGGVSAASVDDWLTEAPRPEAARRGGGGLRELAFTVWPGLASDAFQLAAAPGAGSTRVSAWGRLATTAFEGADTLAATEGTARTLTLGGDVERGPLIAGLAVSHTSGDGGFRILGNEESSPRPGDDARSTLTGVYPYARFGGERLTLWGAGGSARGDLTLTGDGHEVDADLAAGMGSFGARGTWLGVGPFEIALKSDILHTWLTASGARLPEVEAAVSRVRLLLEASGSSELAGGRLISAMELGVRHDSGSADAGTGMEVGGRLRFVGARRLTLSAEGRAVAAHGAEAFGEWGMAGTVIYAPRPSGTGASFRLLPSWGTSSSSAERIWADPEDWLRPDSRRPFRLDAEYAYQFQGRRIGAVSGPYIVAGYRSGRPVGRTGWRIEGPRARVDFGVLHRASTQPGSGGVGALLKVTYRPASPATGEAD